MMVGVLIGIFATLAYALDAFRSQSNEMFIMNMVFKVCEMENHPFFLFFFASLTRPRV